MSSLRLLLVDGRPVVLVGFGGEEFGDLSLDLLLSGKQKL
jgi:hypothetical protein